MKKNSIIVAISLAMIALFTSCSQKVTNSFSYVPSSSAYHNETSKKVSGEEKEETNLNSLTKETVKTDKEDAPVLENIVSVAPQHINSKEVNDSKDEIVMKEATKSTKQLSKKEKRALRKDLKKKLKEMRSNGSDASDIDPVILAILSIIFPLAPLMMYLYEGDITNRFWISLVLTILFWLPGVIYNFLVMFEVI